MSRKIQKAFSDLKISSSKSKSKSDTSNRRGGKKKLKHKPGLLPPMADEDEGKLTLVLDMDETLVHTKFPSLQNEQFRQNEKRAGNSKVPWDFSIKLPNAGTVVEAHVYKRPGLDDFLNRIHKKYEVVIFTAALPVYASRVLDILDPFNKLFKYRLYRDSTVDFKGQSFCKDLKLFGRDMKRIILVDNNPLALLPTLSNAVPITSFFDDQDDSALEELEAMLEEMSNLKDVRPYLTKHFRLEEQMKVQMPFLLSG